MGIASDLVFIIAAALFGGLIAHLCRQPLIFGYMLAGVAVGPYTGGITVENIHDIEMLAEIGVALLLFTLGLEFSFGELRRVWRIAFLATPLQIVLCAVMGYLISITLGLSAHDGIWIGGAISLSSTMIVLKTLSARNALESKTGRTMLAILIAQDVALVPIMLLLPQLTSDSVSLIPIAIAMGKSALFLVVRNPNALHESVSSVLIAATVPPLLSIIAFCLFLYTLRALCVSVIFYQSSSIKKGIRI